jgi:poly(A) polymerase
MVRALRQAARTGFEIEENTLQAIYRNRRELKKANPSRLVEEILKDLRGGAAVTFFRKLSETGLLETFLPALAGQFNEDCAAHPLLRRLEVLDRWSCDGRGPSNAVLLSVLLHTVVMPDPAVWTGESMNPPGVWRSLQGVFQEVSRHVHVSRLDRERITQILLAFHKLLKFCAQGELSPSYQKKTYLSEALDFVEVELESLGGKTDIIKSWRRRYAQEPEQASTRRQGAPPVRRGRPARARDSKKKTTGRSAGEGRKATGEASAVSRKRRNKRARRRDQRRRRKQQSPDASPS